MKVQMALILETTVEEAMVDHQVHDSNSRFVCINNNDNTVVEGEEPDLACEECFAANSNLQTAIEDFLVDFDGIIIDAGPFGIFVLGPGTDTIEQLCDMIESSASLYGIPFSDVASKVISFRYS